MTPRFKTAAVFACALLPALAHAESSQSMTRAQVRQELRVLEQNGYQPNRDDYPVTLEQAREAIAQQRSSTDTYSLPTKGNPG